MVEPRPTLRVDKWLWHARFAKSRALAARLVAGGHLRVNAEKVAKPARPVGAGDTLTFPQGARVRVVRIAALGTRRGPAPEARALYEDLTPAEPDASPPGDAGGRPTKKERRDYERARGRWLD